MMKVMARVPNLIWKRPHAVIVCTSNLNSKLSLNSKNTENMKNLTSAAESVSFVSDIHSSPLTTSKEASDDRLPYLNEEKINQLSLRKRKRLDEICVELYPQFSRTLIQSWILQGKVFVNGTPVLKSGTQVTVKSNVEIKAQVPKFVCRAGFKLEKAIDHFHVDVTNAVVLDAGLSTGGFSDCLLQNGASRIYGVDVGYGQVAEKIRTDPKVVVMERTNLRHLKKLPELVDLVTLDLSFISILLVMPAVVSVMKPEASLLTLIKPQFEAKRGHVGHGGIVRDPDVHKEVLDRIIGGIKEFGMKYHGHITSPIKGTDGNVEFLAYFTRI